jgi:hypothetical protein
VRRVDFLDADGRVAVECLADGRETFGRGLFGDERDGLVLRLLFGRVADAGRERQSFEQRYRLRHQLRDAHVLAEALHRQLHAEARFDAVHQLQSHQRIESEPRQGLLRVNARQLDARDFGELSLEV